MATDLELIALKELKKTLFELNDTIIENNATPERQVQHVLPFMKSNIIKAIDIIKAIEDNVKKP